MRFKLLKLYFSRTFGKRRRLFGQKKSVDFNYKSACILKHSANETKLIETGKTLILILWENLYMYVNMDIYSYISLHTIKGMPKQLILHNKNLP